MTWQERLTEEQEQLEDRIERLRNFCDNAPVYKTLSDPEQGRLKVQLHIMKQYDAILKERLANIDVPEE